jgi:hypothetical protein
VSAVWAVNHHGQFMIRHLLERLYCFLDCHRRPRFGFGIVMVDAALNGRPFCFLPFHSRVRHCGQIVGKLRARVSQMWPHSSQVHSCAATVTCFTDM